MKRIKRILLSTGFAVFLLSVLTAPAFAASTSSTPGVSVNLGNGTSDSLKILVTLTAIALIPSILIMMTAFTRIIIVLSCVRNAAGLQQTPPNQVLVGLALCLTLFIMSPVINEINTTAYKPYTEGTITQDVAMSNAIKPLRTFMLKQTKSEDMNLFLSLAKQDRPKSDDDIKTEVIIPAFITSELRRAFTIGLLIYLPFLVIDMVVASVLTSMGMVMLPPTMISLPFKLMLFVLVDGWGLIVKTLVVSFN